MAGSSSSESELELVDESEVLLVEEDELLDEFVEDFLLRSGATFAGCFVVSSFLLSTDLTSGFFGSTSFLALASGLSFSFSLGFSASGSSAAGCAAWSAVAAGVGFPRPLLMCSAAFLAACL